MNLRLCFVFLFLLSCSSKFPICISEESKQLEIHWGILYLEPRVFEERFILSSSGVLYKSVNSQERIKLKKINPNVYCSLLMKVNNTILTTQAINELGDTLNFVEYRNQKLGVYFSAKWQPRFKTKNSAQFRELFDTLKVLTFEIKN